MRILWLGRTVPLPLDAGDRIYTARLVEAVARAGANVHYLGLANPERRNVRAAQLDPIVCWETVPGRPLSTARAMLSRRPLVGARFGTAVYKRRIASLLRQNRYDAIVIDQYGLAWAMPLIRRVTGSPKAVVVHIAHDFETDVTRSIAKAYRGNLVRKAALYINSYRTARAERTLAHTSDLIVSLTEHDRDLFRGIGAAGDCIVIPPGYDGSRRETRSISPQTPRRVGIVGSYRWQAKQMNLSAFLTIAEPLLADAGIELAIVGDVTGDFEAEWLARTNTVRFMGFVDDLADFLDSCRLGLVIEAIGGGFKLKVLDYVLTRTPVAALRAALCGQLETVTRHFLTEEGPAELARAVIAHMDDLDHLNAMQEGAYRAAAECYNWDSNGRVLLGAIKKAAGQRAVNKEYA